MNNVSFKEKIADIWYNNKKQVIIVGLILILAIIVTTLVSCNKNEHNSSTVDYKDIERIMLLNAQHYIENNKITNDTYIALNSLNIKLDDELNCEAQSGVYKKGDNYYPYLMCNGYESKTISNVIEENKQNDTFATLKGSNPLIVVDAKYVEPGYEVEPKYTINVKKSHIKEGINEVVYYINENNKNIGELKRIVIVNGLKGEAPTLELIGSGTKTVIEGSKYFEMGYKAKDEIDGDLTDKVKVEGTVDTKIPGTYEITYSVTNSSKINTTKTRKVIVVENEIIDLDASYSLSTKELTNKGVTINFNSTGNGFKKVVLPDNSEKTEREIKYVVYKNGTYDFLLYDINSNYESFSVDVNNIDTDKPTGSCSGTTKDNVTTLKVDASDATSGIASYSYIYGGKSYSGNKEMTINSKQTDVKVEITDKATNKTTVTCQIEEIVTTPPNPESSSGVISGGTPVSGTSGSSDLITNYLPGNSVDFMNRKIASTAKFSGLYTRNAVVNVATTLIRTLESYNYRIPYQLGGRYSTPGEWGLNPNWGKYDPSNARYPRVGLDCRNFVIWVYKQAGLSLVRGYGYEGSVSKIYDNRYSNFEDGKPGDVIDGLPHIMLIVGKDATGYTIAESNGVGYVRMMHYTFYNIKSAGYYVYNMDAVYNNTGMYCSNTASYRPYPGSCRIPSSALPSYY